MRRKNNLNSPEQPSFELPSLPPWRTPRIKIAHTTPLRRGPILDEPEEEEGDLEAEYYSGEFLNRDNKLLQKQLEETSAYDYSALSTKKLISESKIDQFLKAETAMHCLVFYKNRKKHSLKDFRPDLNVWCCDSSEDESELEEAKESHTASRLKNKYRRNKKPDNKNILSHIPGVSKEELEQILAQKPGINSSTYLPRPNVRRIDDILNHETNTLRRFLNNESEVTNTLSRQELHDQYLILQQEQELIHQCKQEISSTEHVGRTNALPDDEDEYQWLKNQCHQIWEQESWM